jgi:hypothetical protein
MDDAEGATSRAEAGNLAVCLAAKTAIEHTGVAH